MYRELAPSRGAGIQCTWERLAQAGSAPLIVPDGCADLVWFADGRIEIVGPDTTPRRLPMAAHDEIAGVRLAPGTARSLLSIPVSEIRDRQIPIADLGDSWRRLHHRLTAHHPATAEPATAQPRPAGPATAGPASRAAALGERRTALAKAVAAMPRSPGDPLASRAVTLLSTRPELRVQELADRLGISTRQLNRRFRDAVGYGPKMYARIARLHRFLRVAGTDTGLATAALRAGYAGQSHLTDEVRALTSLTPVRFLEDRIRPPF